jgi:hypothetical protein
MKLLILGGYGTFGGRLATLLAGEPRVTLLIAGRSLDKAAAFCAALAPGAPRCAVLFDRNGDVAAQLARIEPDVVVDATGPFQLYGDHPYRVVEACIAHGIHYLDLADGSDFVKGIAQFDQAARERNVYVLAGVSSFPVLTAAVVRRLARDMQQVRSITAGIAPSPYAGVGLNVIRAISSYAGKRLKLVRGGRPAHGHALVETLRYTIAPPGHLPLRNIRFSLVDVPDLQALPGLWPDLQEIWIGAGPVPEVLHRMLNLLARLVRLRLLPTLAPFAPIFNLVINVVRWGEHRGGMFVAIGGIDRAGKAAERSWHLLAEGDDGPFIPSMAVQAIVLRALDGLQPAAGARPAVGELELEHYEPLFRNRTIYSGERGSADAAAPLYQRVLDEAWDRLPPQLRAMHQCTSQMTASGTAQIERGNGILARVAAAVVGFPKAGREVPVQVRFECKDGAETWRRTFAGKSFSSVQSAGRGRADKLLDERFGPVTFGLGLVLQDDKLYLVVRRWNFLGIPLPAALAPNGVSFESVQDGRFCFDVEIRHPWTGLIVRYRGCLAIDP